MIATYQRTIFEKGDFSICAFKPENEQEPPQSAVSKYGTFVGTGFNLPHSEDISLNLDGTWESSKYGLQFKISTCISILPKTEEGIIAFLASGVLPYIRNKMAVRLYQTFGNDVFSVLENRPAELLKVRGITEKKLKAIQEAYTINYGYQDLLMLLQPAGISVSKIKKIVDKFGAAATEKVKNNPYVLFTINGFGFKTVDEIAQKTHTPPNDPLRIMGALKFVLTEAQNNGHLCMVQEELRLSAHSMLNEGFENEVVSMEEVTYVIKQMALDGTLKGDNGYAYLAYNYDNESFAAGCIRALLCIREKPVNVESAIMDFEKGNFPLADKQKEASSQAVPELEKVRFSKLSLKCSTVSIRKQMFCSLHLQERQPDAWQKQQDTRLSRYIPVCTLVKIQALTALKRCCPMLLSLTRFPCAICGYLLCLWRR